MDDVTCQRMRALAAELALGVLSGRERAQAQEHLDRCPTCRAEVGELTEIGDRLLSIVPGAEPPIGFEDRVLARLELSPDHGSRASRGSWRRSWRWVPLAAAAAIAALVFGVGGWAVGHLDRPAAVVAAPPASPLRSSVLWAGDHQQVGTVVTYHGKQPWLYLTVDTGKTTTTVSCELERADGTDLLMGRFTLVDGKGSWGGALPDDPSLFRGADLLSADGTVLAAATFGTTADGYGYQPK